MLILLEGDLTNVFKIKNPQVIPMVFKRKKGRGKSRSKSRLRGRRCYSCGKFGHYVKESPKNKGQPGEHANLVCVGNVGDVFIVNDDEHAYVILCFSSLGENGWLIDFACTYHMSPYKHHFSNYMELKNCLFLRLIM